MPCAPQGVKGIDDEEWRTEGVLLWRKSLKIFKVVDVKEFWSVRRKEYPLISDKAVKFPLVFNNVYFFFFFWVWDSLGNLRKE